MDEDPGKEILSGQELGHTAILPSDEDSLSPAQSFKVKASDFPDDSDLKGIIILCGLSFLGGILVLLPYHPLTTPFLFGLTCSFCR